MTISIDLKKSRYGQFFPTIDGIIVDCLALTSIKHSCISHNCDISQCCCSSYEVIIDSIQLSNIINILPFASQHSTNLINSNKSFANVFGDEGRNAYSIDKNEMGMCEFGYKEKEKKILCSLHKASVDMKIPLKSVKPLACILWPLAYVESDPIILTTQENALLFPCNKRIFPPSLEIDHGIAQIVKTFFGSSFLHKIQKSIKGLYSNSKDIQNVSHVIKVDV